MPGFYLYTSNRLEALAEKLAEELRTAPLSPLQREIIVVQSKGMQRWLNLEISRHNSVCANVEYPFPKTFVSRIFREVLGLSAEITFSPEVMTWKIMKVLPALMNEKGFESLRDYITGEASELRRFQLAGKIAGLFDQYIIYRPDMILQWDNGKDSLAVKFSELEWQAALWQRVSESDKKAVPLWHHAALKQHLLNKTNFELSLPRRISVFGISSLPPFYIEIFNLLAERIDVNFYYMNPCRQYWEYVYTEKQIARLAKAGVSEDDQHFERGNSLLASMGATGREFFSLILNMTGGNGEDLFYEPPEATMLSRIQTDILNLRNSRCDAEESRFVSEDDLSVQIHSCHSPMREVEVLYDNLLALFEKKGGLAPKDIVVMMPDVSVYAPLVQALFDTPEDESYRIPYSIADTSLLYSSQAADTFMAILSLDLQRFRAVNVLDILEAEAVYRNFGLAEEDLEYIRYWVKEVGICWGIDGSYRKGLGLPDFHENSWRFGLDRMLLGYALPGEDRKELFSDILPYVQIEGDNVRVLGAFVRFAETLFSYADTLGRPRNLEAWENILNRILSDFFISDETNEKDIKAIRDTLLEKGLAGFKRQTGFDEAVSLDVIRSYLNSRIESEAQARGFISTGVTFCTLLPMRSIPFRVVYVLGMNDGDYPRREQKLGFDLMEKQRRLGDRSKRNEDRYLFLESLLSARENLIISYVGQNIKDNIALPPSVLVSELCDYLQNSFVLAGGKDIFSHVITRHPLQPFSAKYFAGDEKLFSYSKQNFLAAVENLKEEKDKAPFIGPPLPEPAAREWEQVSIEQLYAFFSNPAEFFVRHRLYTGLRVEDSSIPGDREPFGLDNLDQYILQEELVGQYLKGQNFETGFVVAKASGRLPHGKSGELEFRELANEVEAFVDNIRPHLHGGPLAPYGIELFFDNPKTDLKGNLSDLYAKGQFFFRMAKIKAKDLLRAWIYHLALNSCTEYRGDRTTLLYGTDKRINFPTIESTQAEHELRCLLTLLRQGLSAPLCFFPETSYAFAHSVLLKNKDEKHGLKAASNKWYSSYYSGEGEDLYLKKCFDGKMPDSDEFMNRAIEVFNPLFSAMQEEG